MKAIPQQLSGPVIYLTLSRLIYSLTRPSPLAYHPTIWDGAAASNAPSNTPVTRLAIHYAATAP